MTSAVSNANVPHPPKTRCLNLVSGLGAGGIETYLLRLCRNQDYPIESIVLLKQFRPNLTRLSEFEAEGIQVIQCPVSFWNPLNWWRFRRLLQQLGCDVVVDYTGDFAGLTMVLAYLAGIRRRVVWYRTSGRAYHGWHKNVYAWTQRLLVRLFADTILANSSQNFNFFFGSDWSKDSRLQVIHNGIPIEDYRPDQQTRDRMRLAFGIDERTFVIGHVGGFRDAKNHHLIVRIGRALQRRQLNFKVVLVGDGPLQQEIKRAVDEQDLTKYFIFTGFRPDVARIMQSFDVFLFPSTREGMPNALIESCMLGVPFVASRIPAILETLPLELHRWTCDVQDEACFVKKLLEIFSKQDTPSPQELMAFSIEKYSLSSNQKLYYKILGVDALGQT